MCFPIPPKIEARHFEGRRPGGPLVRSGETRAKEAEKVLPAKKDSSVEYRLFDHGVGGDSIYLRYEQRQSLPIAPGFFIGFPERGWFLKSTIRTSNVSTKGGSSLLSGYYDFFLNRRHSGHSGSKVPSIYGWLGEGYDSFLVTLLRSPGIFRPICKK